MLTVAQTFSHGEILFHFQVKYQSWISDLLTNSTTERSCFKAPWKTETAAIKVITHPLHYDTSRIYPSLAWRD
jgi:hypothetical protein